MPSFDVVNTIDMAEVDNAIHQTQKEMIQRFDFKGTDSTIERKDESVVIESVDDYKIRAVVDVFQGKLLKRSVSLKSLKEEKIEPAAGGRVRQKLTLQVGIQADAAKDLVKQIKNTKMKVQAAIQGDLLRISGKKRDDLQEVITFLKSLDYPLPLQYVNFRE